jgi:hypothetical protein
MSDLNPIGETPEIEPTEQVEISETQEQQALDDATFEPESHVEQTGEIAEAEAIEATFVEVVENTAANTEDLGATPLPIPEPAETGGVEDVSTLPVPIPEPTEGIFGPENLDYNEANQQIETLDDKGLEDIEQ